MTDDDLLTLCAFEEANLESDDGVAAVVRVVLNRAALRFQSDGTIPGTVLAGNGAAFSWAAFEMVGEPRHYARVASGAEQIAQRAEGLLRQAKGYKKAWARCAAIVAAVRAGTYAGGALYERLTPDTVMYLNPALSKAAWAVPAKWVTRIGHHSFYRA